MRGVGDGVAGSRYSPPSSSAENLMPMLGLLLGRKVNSGILPLKLPNARETMAWTWTSRYDVAWRLGPLKARTALSSGLAALKSIAI